MLQHDCDDGGGKAFTDCTATAAANTGSTCAERCRGYGCHDCDVGGGGWHGRQMQNDGNDESKAVDEVILMDVFCSENELQYSNQVRLSMIAMEKHREICRLTQFNASTPLRSIRTPDPNQTWKPYRTK